ncbi:hypothetical protein BTO05_03445 [Winogradskyella sp. PC-19]|uniref:lipocalin family protein n=1 Tax=unclassified Winogradskyella TaxID=2615021 RepID=UPI000B3C3045|nr:MULTISPECIES: lipocalin family protein [unclassified Winogradskyella]ARV08737.1 hypothetical protein BTO05_03445 [Winogradskyella sp. PC-19]
MKKILGLLCVFLLCSAFQCDDEPLEGEFITDEAAACEAAIIDTAEAALEFLGAGNDTFTDICSAYKTALEAQIIACGDEDGSLQAIIDQLGDCSVDNLAECQEAILLKNEAEEIFNNSTDTDYTENCNALKEAIQNVIDICGSTQELEDQLEGLGNCILTTSPTASLVGTWRITSLTSNGVEELQDELDAANICFYEEMYTETDLTETDFSGTDCDIETVTDETGYTFENNIISFANGNDSVEVIELTDDILRYQDVYMEGGETFTDIYTFERQVNTTNPAGQITVTAGTLDIVFDEINVEVVGTTLQVSGSTSAANNYTIYFEVEEGETGDDIINAEFVIFFTSEFFPYFDGIEPFRSNISANPDGSLTGTFCCNTRNADNGDLNLTSGMINITY